MVSFESRSGLEGGSWLCGETEPSVVTCTFEELLPAGVYAPELEIEVSAPSEEGASLENQVIVSGGGASIPVSTVERTPVGNAQQAFGILEFSMEARNADGSVAVQAGGHPWQVTTSIGFPWTVATSTGEGLHYSQVQNMKKLAVELPAGMGGNLLATPERCTQVQLHGGICPASSRVGSIALTAGQYPYAEFRDSGEGEPSPVFNMVPEPGYPGQLGFTYLQQPVYVDATVVHSNAGERVRLTVVSVPAILEAGDVVLTVWGEPGMLNGSDSEEALITSPTTCSEGTLTARLEAESWGSQGHPAVAEAPVYKKITGCESLLSPFTPQVALSPLASSGEPLTQMAADTPSGVLGIASIPQTTAFGENAVANVRNVSVTLPQGLSISPAVAQGLVGCQERGPHGINLGTSRIGPGGVDEGNSEATEFGAGHVGGNGSPYDDGQYHAAPGHCPQESIIGTVEVFTPLLENRCGGGRRVCEQGESPAPLQGRVFVAQPQCGGAGQAACTGADAEDGVLFSGYVELSGDGVLIKERATISVSQATGQMSLQLRELPQLPFSEVKVSVEGGPRAPLATPQACGTAMTTSAVTSWSASSGEAFVPVPSFFTVDADGAGRSCPAVWSFTPGFTGGSTSKTAGGFTRFMTTFTRQDREQNVTGLSASTPPGLLAMISSVTPCQEPQASAGECPESSLIGHDTVGAGSGPDPYYVAGKVYLTGSYKGAPFGLDVVTPAAAGPFNLGNILVRAKIDVNPSTAQVTITGDPIPQSQLGVPLRLKALNVTIDREHFVINPTNCAQQHVTAVATGNQGATASLSSPFAVTGCPALPSSPVVKVSTVGKASKRSGAQLTFTLTHAAGQANIKSIKTDLPRQLPSRFSTLQKACPDTVFNANPASCPAGSLVGTSVAHTPILKSPLTGPAYLVSHGGAAFPDLVLVLQGEGVTIEVVGNTAVKHGITSETFKTIPDAPFTSFTATFPQGPHSILATYLPAKAKYNLCGQNLKMPIRITAQNNKLTAETVKIGIAGCKHKTKAKKAKKH